MTPKLSTAMRRKAYAQAMICARTLGDLTRPGFMKPSPSLCQIAPAVRAWAGACKTMLGAEV